MKYFKCDRDHNGVMPGKDHTTALSTACVESGSSGLAAAKSQGLVALAMFRQIFSQEVAANGCITDPVHQDYR